MKKDENSEKKESIYEIVNHGDDEDFEEAADDSGITELPDDSGERRKTGIKRKISRAVKKSAVKHDGGYHVKKSFSASSLIIIAAVLFVIIFAAANVNSGGVLATFNGQVSSFFSKKSAENFTYSFSAESVYGFASYDDGFALLTEDGIMYVDSSGEITAKQSLNYGDIAMDINGRKTMLFDRGGTSYSLLYNQSMYFHNNTDDSIIDGAVSGKDNYAVVVREDKTKTSLYVYNKNSGNIYLWRCTDGYISDVSLSPSGKKGAVTVLNSKNAVMSSTVYILDFSYDTEYASFSYQGQAVLGTKFLSEKKVLSVTDEKVYLIDNQEQSEVFSYGDNDIYYCSMDSSSDLTGIITTDYSHDDLYTLTVINSSGKTAYTQGLSGKVRGIDTSDKCAVVLYADKIETYSKGGNLVGTVTGIKYYNDIIVSSNYIYVLSSDSVKKYPAYGEIKAEDSVIEDQTGY